MPRSIASIAYFTASGAFAMILRAIDSAVGKQLRRFGYAVHQTDSQRLLGGDHFSGQNQLVRDSFAAQAGQTLRAAIAGQNSESSPPAGPVCAVRLAMRIVQASASSHPPPERETVDRRDRRLSQRFEHVKDRLPAQSGVLAVQSGLPRKFVDIRAGNECFFSRARQNQHADSDRRGARLRGNRRSSSIVLRFSAFKTLGRLKVIRAI